MSLNIPTEEQMERAKKFRPQIKAAIASVPMHTMDLTMIVALWHVQQMEVLENKLADIEKNLV